VLPPLQIIFSRSQYSACSPPVAQASQTTGTDADAGSEDLRHHLDGLVLKKWTVKSGYLVAYL
jgi:hypothetical protein